jgi:hypothetical protein
VRDPESLDTFSPFTARARHPKIYIKDQSLRIEPYHYLTELFAGPGSTAPVYLWPTECRAMESNLQPNSLLKVPILPASQTINASDEEQLLYLSQEPDHASLQASAAVQETAPYSGRIVFDAYATPRCENDVSAANSRCRWTRRCGLERAWSVLALSAN